MSRPIRSASLPPLAFALTVTAALAAKDDSKVIFVDQSNWSINELYFAPTNDSDRARTIWANTRSTRAIS